MYYKLVHYSGCTMDVKKDICPEGYEECTEEEYNDFINNSKIQTGTLAVPDFL